MSLSPADDDLAVAPTDAAAPHAGAERAALTPAEIEAAAQAAVAKAAADAEAAEAAEREARLQRLMQRISAHADFPSLKDSIRSIQKIARSDKTHLRVLTDEVLSDVALTGKLLRLINAAYYRSVGGGEITSMQRAVALMGFQAIGMLAASLALFDRLPKGRDGARVRQEFGSALLSALLAQELCHSGKHLQDAYITTLFQNLGLMLAWMHFPEEATAIEAELAAHDAPARDADAHQQRQQVSRQTLGLSYEELGVEVARQWGWPDALQLALRRLPDIDPERPATPDEYLRLLCTAASELAPALQRLPVTGTAEERAAARETVLQAFAARAAVPLSLDPETLGAAVERALANWAALGQMLGLEGAAGAIPATSAAPGARRPTPLSGPQSHARAPRHAPAAAVPKPAASTTPSAPARSIPPRDDRPSATGQALTEALEQVSQLAMGDAPLGQVLQAVIGQMQQCLALQRAIVCLRDGARGDLQGRLGLGDRATALATRFRVPMQPPTDLFGLLCARSADTLITDTTDPVIARRLPGWYAEAMQAHTFVLLPLVHQGQVLGLLYGDRVEAGSLQLPEQTLNLLKALRNQLLMAIRLRGPSG
jgi:HD-like signal output (HDOD) protein